MHQHCVGLYSACHRRSSAVERVLKVREVISWSVKRVGNIDNLGFQSAIDSTKLDRVPFNCGIPL